MDKESYLDWGLSSDFESVQGALEVKADEKKKSLGARARFRVPLSLHLLLIHIHSLLPLPIPPQVGGGHHVRNRREVIPAAGQEGAVPSADETPDSSMPLMKLGLGGGALGSEGYGEATMGSVHRIGVA